MPHLENTPPWSVTQSVPWNVRSIDVQPSVAWRAVRVLLVIMVGRLHLFILLLRLLILFLKIFLNNSFKPVLMKCFDTFL